MSILLGLKLVLVAFLLLVLSLYVLNIIEEEDDD